MVSVTEELNLKIALNFNSFKFKQPQDWWLSHWPEQL